MENKETGNTGTANSVEKKNLLEWIVFFSGLAITLSVISYLGYKALTEQKTPPEITVKYYVEPGKQAPNRLRIEVKNTGNETAAQVLVEANLYKAAEILQSGNVTIEFVPKKSLREAWIIFSQKPENADSVKVRVVSYREP